MGHLIGFRNYIFILLEAQEAFLTTKAAGFVMICDSINRELSIILTKEGSKVLEDLKKNISSHKM